MALIDITEVQEKFEVWEDYCTINGLDKTAEEVLQDKIDDGETELLEYLTVDEDTITAIHQRHLMNIIRYNCFRVKHGDTEFENKPQIVVDYERTIEALKQMKVSDELGAAQDLPQLKAKTRIFDEGGWFTDEAG
jgi:hypothetical protein